MLNFEVIFLSERVRGEDILASHYAGIQPYWVDFQDGWYALHTIGAPPLGPFNSQENTRRELQVFRLRLQSSQR